MAKKRVAKCNCGQEYFHLPEMTGGNDRQEIDCVSCGEKISYTWEMLQEGKKDDVKVPCPKHFKKKILIVNAESFLNVIKKIPECVLPDDADLLDLRMAPESEGRIEIKLCSDEWPKTVENAIIEKMWAD